MWWDLLNETGPLYAKTHMMVKPQYINKAKKLFKDTSITISEEGERYLGGAVGQSFVQTFVQRKVEGWVREVEKLSKFAETQPHSAYAAFTHGLMSKWNYLLRVVDWDTLSSAELLQPLESAIQSRFNHRSGSSWKACPRFTCSTSETWWSGSQEPHQHGQGATYCFTTNQCSTGRSNC